MATAGLSDSLVLPDALTALLLIVSAAIVMALSFARPAIAVSPIDACARACAVGLVLAAAVTIHLDHNADMAQQIAELGRRATVRIRLNEDALPLDSGYRAQARIISYRSPDGVAQQVRVPVVASWRSADRVVPHHVAGVSPDNGEVRYLSGDYITLPLSELSHDAEILYARASAAVKHSPGALSEQRRRGLAGLYRAALLLPSDVGDLLIALLTGRRLRLDSEVSETFRRSGNSHALALSGMHLAVLVGGVGFAAGRVRGKMAGLHAGMLAAIVYVGFVGPGASLQRALLMLAIAALGVLASRRMSLMQVLSMSFIALLVITPGLRDDIGFQLSCAALTGICVLQDTLSMRLRAWLHPVLARICAVSAGAWLGTLPLSLYYFGAAYPVGLFVAPVAGFGITGILYLGIGTMMLSSWPMLTLLFSLPLRLLWWATKSVMSLAAGFPAIIVAPGMSTAVITSLVISLAVAFAVRSGGRSVVPHE